MRARTTCPICPATAGTCLWTRPARLWRTSKSARPSATTTGPAEVSHGSRLVTAVHVTHSANARLLAQRTGRREHLDSRLRSVLGLRGCQVSACRAARIWTAGRCARSLLYQSGLGALALQAGSEEAYKQEYRRFDEGKRGDHILTCAAFKIIHKLGGEEKAAKPQAAWVWKKQGLAIPAKFC